jgi:predicted DNA-binding transcriptional regulator AlpA
MAHGDGGRIDVVADFGKIGDDILLTEKEAAKIVSFSRHALRNWRIADKGRGPKAVIINRSVRYPAGALRAWLQSLV